MTVAAVTMSDEEVQGFADSLIEVHTQVVRTKGLDLSRAVSTEKEEAIRGRIISVAAPCFGTVFGQPPSERYRDAFFQIAVFAQHFAKDHIFADGNKRTTVIACFSLLDQIGLEVAVPDSQTTITNEVYRVIQGLVTEEIDVEEFARFLRLAAQLPYVL